MEPVLIHPLAAVATLALAQAQAVKPMPPVPDPVGFAGGFGGIKGGVLMVGGGANFPDGVMPWDGGTKVWHDRIFALDLTFPGASWHEAGHLPVPNGYGVSLTLPEGVLIIGGGDATRHFKEVRLMGLKEGKAVFEDFPELPVGLAQMAGALVGRKVHVCGGIESPQATSASSGHWMLDLDERGKGWQKQPDLPAAGRILAAAAGVGDGFYLTGGCSLAPDVAGKAQRTYLREAWKFADGKWTRLAEMPRAAVAAASPAPVKGKSIYIVSGDDGTQVGLAPTEHKGFTREILRYEVEGNVWKTAGKLELPAPVTLPTVPWQGSYVFFNGEVKPGVRTPQVFLFTPEP